MFLVNFTVRAQGGPSTKASIERLKTESLWLTHTPNAAGMYINLPYRYSFTTAGFKRQDGTFRRPAEGKKNDVISFHSDGGSTVDAMYGMYMWGQFDYSRSKLRERQFDATLIDPFRGMPFITGDDVASQWIITSYNLQAKLGTPKLWDRIYFGVDLSYEGATGSKQRDPRTENFSAVNKFSVIPGVVFEISDQHYLGATFEYYTRRESADPRPALTNDNAYAYNIVYPGYWTEGAVATVSGLNTRKLYNANGMGGGLQYNFDGKLVKLLLTGKYTRRVEDVKNANTIPQMVGTVKEDLWTADLAGRFIMDCNNLYVKFGYLNRYMKGIQYLQYLDNDPAVNEWITVMKNVRSKFSTEQYKLSVDHMINNPGRKDYAWKFGVWGMHETLNDTYLLPTTTQDITSFTVGANVRKNFVINDLHSILLGVNGSFKNNTDAEYVYGGNQNTSPLYAEYTLADLYYLASGYNNVGGSLYYTFSGFLNNKASLCVGVEYGYYKACENDDIKQALPTGEFDHRNQSFFNNRNYLTFKVGLAF